MKLAIPFSKCDNVQNELSTFELVSCSISPLTVFVINCLYKSLYGNSIQLMVVAATSTQEPIPLSCPSSPHRHSITVVHYRKKKQQGVRHDVSAE